MSLGQLLIEALALLELLDKSVVVVNLKVFAKFQLAFIQDVFDSYNLLVVSYEVIESNSTFEANEGRCKVIKNRRLLKLPTHRQQSVRKANPRASRRINLVRLILVFVFEVLMVVVDEVPDLGNHVTICPFEPIFNRRLYIKDSVAVEFSGIHFTYLVLRTVFSTVYTSKDKGVGV